MKPVPDAQLPGPIEIRPEVTMLSVLRHLNYKAWFAIAEFIDNALQSYLANREALEAINGPNFRLEVDVRIDTNGPGLIVVTDNAAGISTADFPRAFRAAQVPTDRTGLSEFGMGMKSAACWFAERWSVRTKAVGEGLERTIHFDIRHIVDNKIESLDTEAREVGDPSAHYTVVTLRGLHHIPQGRTLGKIKDHLASIYRMFLRDGRMTLRFNGEPLTYATPPILKAQKYVAPGVPAQGAEASLIEWRKDIQLDFGKGQSVTGFAALRETGSTPLAGFALFRRDRLIEGSHDETYRPSFIFKQTNSYPYQRLFGELHVEGFEVSHTKDGFRWEEYEDVFLEFLKAQLEAEPLNLLAQADNYRALPSKKSIEARAAAATDSVVGYIEKDVAPVLVEAKASPTDAPSLPQTLVPSALQASERSVCVNDGLWDWVITIRTTVDLAREDWVSLAKQDPRPGDLVDTRRLVVELALAHPFSSEFLGANNENIELFLRIATAVSISLVLAEDHTGEPPEVVLHHFNQLMRGALSHSRLNNDDHFNQSA
ncbi:ATP-binding protein [Burkholderia multivorans]|uniref:ATP-binding protein n=1 Tax=Burkholderia multivorans TaxID=87883 RepID=UPI002019B1CE|nr:ATP-binding protein [Burkholderia multivorans]MCO1372495.1 ATP-binding protein [Burkholderia multivorans]MCO1456260.1 ATP-binding protein [Burkholderia multivorans]MCO1465241.1 ATP-binding protein [Burkholderia multivorans]UQO18723.1 ATP-binding protein [Burkholderia multivorans]UQO87251.1 ATP-binding protein [Burkholderia multivorans]